jgi:hypothetical protein
MLSILTSENGQLCGTRWLQMTMLDSSHNGNVTLCYMLIFKKSVLGKQVAVIKQVT